MIRGWILHQSEPKNWEILGFFSISFLCSFICECCYVYTLISCIFVAHGIIFNLFYKSISVFVLVFALCGVLVCHRHMLSESLLEWISIRLWILDIGFSPDNPYKCRSLMFSVFRGVVCESDERELYGCQLSVPEMDTVISECWMILGSIVGWV